MLVSLNFDGWPGGFGLGVVQWTFSRTLTLVELYIEVAGGNNTITLEQIVFAEGLMIIRELEGDFDFIYPDWEAACAIKEFQNRVTKQKIG